MARLELLGVVSSGNFLANRRGTGSVVPLTGNDACSEKNLVNDGKESAMPKHVFAKEEGMEWADQGPADNLLQIEDMTEEDVLVVLRRMASMRGGNVEFEIRDVAG